MTERQKSLSARREELIARSNIQREQLVAQIAGVWQPGAIPVGKNILMQARKKPLLSGFLAFLAYLFFRRSRLFSLFATGALMMKTWRRFSSFFMPLFGKLKPLRRKKR